MRIQSNLSDIKPTHFIILLASVFSLIGCGAMFSLNWRFAINEYQTTYAAMYLAKDGNSFFRIGSQPNNGVRDTRLEQYNLEGELINHFSLGTTTLLYTHKHPLEIPNSN